MNCDILCMDGVGEGDIHTVCTHGNLKSHLRWTYGDRPYKMALISIIKRINSRLFLNGGNPPPGTVVDDSVTMPERYDFYHVSRSVHHSTVTPTAYTVVSNNVGLDTEKLQRLAY